MGNDWHGDDWHGDDWPGWRQVYEAYEKHLNRERPRRPWRRSLYEKEQLSARIVIIAIACLFIGCYILQSALFCIIALVVLSVGSSLDFFLLRCPYCNCRLYEYRKRHFCGRRRDLYRFDVCPGCHKRINWNKRYWNEDDWRNWS